MNVSFGVFDHLDNKDVPLQQLYEERLQLIEQYEHHGLYAYHLAEHQGTPIGMAPSPSVFLSSVAQRTRHIRFGPLVYVLPLYNPVRLASEICMLDHLSGGRLELGLGRGISAFEMAFFNISHLESADVFEEAFGVLLSALTSDKVRHRGTFFKFLDVPMMLKPVQKPHPPLWYGIGSERSAQWAAQRGMNVVSNAPCEPTRIAVEAYKKALPEMSQANATRTAPKIGIARHIYVAQTDAEAERIAGRAGAAWFRSFSKLWRDHGGQPMRYSSDLPGLKSVDAMVCGSPATVCAEIERQIAATGCNYFVCRFAYGDLTLDESRRSLDLFAAEVLPRFGKSADDLPATAAASTGLR